MKASQDVCRAILMDSDNIAVRASFSICPLSKKQVFRPCPCLVRPAHYRGLFTPNPLWIFRQDKHHFVPSLIEPYPIARITHLAVYFSFRLQRLIQLVFCLAEQFLMPWGNILGAGQKALDVDSESILSSTSGESTTPHCNGSLKSMTRHLDYLWSHAHAHVFKAADI